MSNVQKPSGEVVSFPCGPDTVSGFLSRADRADAPGIVLIPDVHGLSDLYRRLATRFAREGISTLALDIYTREGTPSLGDMDAIFRWMADLPDPQVIGDVQAAVATLVRDHGVPEERVGVTGFCMGGQYALLSACQVRGLGAGVSFYGMVRYRQTNEKKPRSPLDAVTDLSCPWLGIFGEEDPIIPLDDVEELRRRLETTRQAWDVRTYPGCGHAFLNDQRPEAYRPEAAEDAFRRAVEFFQRHLQRR